MARTWITKVNNVDTVDAAHVNDLQTYKLNKDELPYVRPEDYGAVGDGVHDDKAAIQAAIDAVASAGGAVLFAPKSYRVNSAIKVLADNVHLLGTTVGYGTQISGYGAINVIELGNGSDAIEHGSITNINVNSGDSLPTRLIYARYAHLYTFTGVLTGGGTTAGMAVENCYSQRYYGCYFLASDGDGIKLSGPSHDIQFFGTSMIGNDGWGIYDYMGSGRRYDLYCENNGGGGLYLFQIRGFAVVGGYWESNTGYDIRIHTACSGGNVSPGYMLNYTESNHVFIDISDSENINFGGFCVYSSGAQTGHVALNIGAGSTGIYITPFTYKLDGGATGTKISGALAGTDAVVMNAQYDGSFFYGPVTFSNLVGLTPTDSPSFETVKLSALDFGDIPYAGCTPASSGLELVSNGGFDSATTDWTPVNCTLSSDAGGQSGNCLTITTVSGTLQYAQQAVTGLVVGESYVLSAWIKSGTSGNQTGYIQLDPAGYAEATSSGSWVNITDKFVATATTGQLYLAKASATAGTMLFDTVSLLRVTEFTPSPLSTDGTDVDNSGVYKVDAVQVVGPRVIDARCDDAINSGDATTDGVIDALRDAMIAHGLIAAA
jgi:hypothetical protein